VGYTASGRPIKQRASYAFEETVPAGGSSVDMSRKQIAEQLGIEVAEPDTFLVDKVLGRRKMEDEEFDRDTEEYEMCEYLVKFVGKSYMHSEWLHYDTLIHLNKR
jgi:hypothetical protein